MNPLARLYEWFSDHPGGRLIISSTGFELCARHLKHLPDDESRFISFEGGLHGVSLADELDHMLDEIEDWEQAGWEYEDD